MSVESPPRLPASQQIVNSIFGRNRRAILPQAIFLVAVAALLVWLLWTISANLQRFDLGFSFSFLAHDAGFQITQTPVHYTPASSYARALLIAILNTIVLSCVVIVLSTILGTIIGLIGLSANRVIAGTAAAYVEIVRNIPLLLHILFWYFALLRPLPGPRQGIDILGLFFLNNRGLSIPSARFASGGWIPLVAFILAACWVWSVRRARLKTGRQLPALLPSVLIFLAVTAIGIASGQVRLVWSLPALKGFNVSGGMAFIPEFVAMVASLTVYAAAFVAELVRGGVESIPRGQGEAARSLGLHKGQEFRLVILPQTLKVIIPPLVNVYLDVIKDSSLGAFIAYPEIMLVFGGTVLNQTDRPLEVMSIVAVTYLVISISVSFVMNLYNRSVMKKEG